MARNNDTKGLIQDLADGFKALYDQYEALERRHTELTLKLRQSENWSREVNSPSEARISLSENVKLDPSSSRRVHKDWVAVLELSTDPTVSSCGQAIRRANIARGQLLQNKVDKESEVKNWNEPSADPSNLELPGKQPSFRLTERDFTTSGIPSKLGCPFAAMGGQKPDDHPSSASGRGRLSTPRSSQSRLSAMARRSKRPSFHDPIEAEMGINGVKSPMAPPSVSVDGSAPRCPIRFLDQHSPEEVAKYFENHKHELPRSHELCVKRYQRNEESIRQLDEKYGDLVSMIQGLGVKHQAMLPEDPDEEAIEEVEDERQKVDKVAKWARNVSSSLRGGEDDEGDPPAQPAPQEMDEDTRRVQRFERPLREVRVGESPSRPWGISVPVKYTELAASKEEQPTKPPVIPTSASPPADPAQSPKCPFDHGARLRDTNVKSDQAVPKATTADPVVYDKPMVLDVYPVESGAKEKARTVRHVVFNGPVFIGYPAEQAAVFFQQLGVANQH